MFIIASVGLNNFFEEKIKKIILAGADALRYSFSYGPIENTIDRIKVGMKVIDELNSSAKIIVRAIDCFKCADKRLNISLFIKL